MPRKKTKQKIGRANGMGSVYKLSGNRRRPWVAKVTTERKLVEGKYVQEREVLGYYETEEEADQALASHLVNPEPLKAKMTLQELYDEWSEIHYTKIKNHTKAYYKSAWKHMKHLGKIQFSEIRRGEWEKIIIGMDKEGYARNTIQPCLILMKMLSDYAVQNDIITRSYAKGIKLPKNNNKKSTEVFTDLEIKKILDQAGKIPWMDTVAIFIYTGFRISELLNLTVFDVDLEKGIITGGTKTDAGMNRQVPIHHKIMPLVKERYNQPGTYLIHDSESSKPLGVQKFREEYYYKALEEAGIEKKTPHVCRSTCASMMAKAGVSTLTIQRIMGHTSYNMTEQHYTYVDPEQLKNEFNII